MEPKEKTFKQKVASSAQLSTLKFVSEVMVRLISTVVLTRLLTPETYGIFAVVLVYMYLLEMFSDFGLRSLILTKEDPVEDDFLHTVWTVSILRGCAIWLLSGSIAFGIWALQSQTAFAADSAYAATVLPAAILALGGVAFIKGFQSSNLFMAERGMMFGRVTLIQICVNVVALITTIALAIYLRSVWALVLGAMVRSLLEVGFSFWLFKGPSMHLSLTRKNLLLVYDRGKWIIGHSILTALSTSADRLFLGLVMNSASFGLYAIARQIIDLFMRFLVSLNAQMGLQVFTHILQAETAVFRKNYYRYRLVFDAISGIFTGGLLVVSPFIVSVLFDDRYQGAAPLIEILCWGLLVLSPLILRSAFSAERRFKAMTVLSLATTLTIWVGLAISLLVFESVTAALFCIALHKLPEAILLWIRGFKRGWISPIRELGPLVFLPVGMALGWLVLQLKEYI